MWRFLNFKNNMYINSFTEVRTKFGRRRLIPEIFSSDFSIYSEAERQAFNTVIQGTAADLIKRSMINLFEKLTERKFVTTIVAQIHDEVPLSPFLCVMILLADNPSLSRP